MTTTHHATFRLGRCMVRFSDGVPVTIADGDWVRVAGAFGQGMLHADAIRNETTGMDMHTGILSRLLFAAGTLVIGLILFLHAVVYLSPGGLGLSVLAFLIAAFQYLRVSQTRRALAWVRSTASLH